MPGQISTVVPNKKWLLSYFTVEKIDFHLHNVGISVIQLNCKAHIYKNRFASWLKQIGDVWVLSYLGIPATLMKVFNLTANRTKSPS